MALLECVEASGGITWGPLNASSHAVSVLCRYLDLQDSQLTGSIPSTIGNCVNLQ